VIDVATRWFGSKSEAGSVYLVVIRAVQNTYLTCLLPSFLRKYCHLSRLHLDAFCWNMYLPPIQSIGGQCFWPYIGNRTHGQANIEPLRNDGQVILLPTPIWRAVSCLVQPLERTAVVANCPDHSLLEVTQFHTSTVKQKGISRREIRSVHLFRTTAAHSLGHIQCHSLTAADSGNLPALVPDTPRVYLRTHPKSARSRRSACAFGATSSTPQNFVMRGRSPRIS